MNAFQHRKLIQELLGTRDRVAVAILTHMFSLTDTFTCFEDGDYQPRSSLFDPSSQNAVSDFILISSDTSLRHTAFATPNASTDGSFTKSWRYEQGKWWLYKIQPENAVRSEVEISRALRRCGWDAAEYRYVDNQPHQIRSLNFVGDNEFFEPYESFRYCFKNRSDHELVILENLASIGLDGQWMRILAADAFFLNTDRHMRNFGVIRSSDTGEVLRLAPNFDNNQAYTANPGGFNDEMLRSFMSNYPRHSKLLRELMSACAEFSYLSLAVDAAARILC